MAPSLEVMATVAPTEYYSRGLRERFRLDASALKPSIVAKDQAYADIDYSIDEAKYRARSEAIVRAGGLETEVPRGWPNALQGPLVWTGTDFKDEAEYVLYLTDADKVELVEALDYFKEQGLDGDQVDRGNFPLPILSKRLERASCDVYEGRGFVIIRGVDPDAFSAEDFAVIYLGVSSYIAERRGKQDQRGSMLMHAMLKGNDDHRDYDKPFHTDTVCDCLGLVTQSCSAKGGKSIIASFWTVYNELAATRPDLIHVLAKPDWPFDTYGRDPPYYRRALLYYQDGKAILNVSRRLLVGHAPRDPRTKGIPGLTEAQAEALDALHFVAEKHEIRPTMEKGDMRLFNNMGILHRREAFKNDSESERHLIRLWLNNEEKCWKLPAPLRLAWARVFEDDERGAFWDIEPPRKNGMVLRVAGSCD
jgi:hypothetical protein